MALGFDPLFNASPSCGGENIENKERKKGFFTRYRTDARISTPQNGVVPSLSAAPYRWRSYCRPWGAERGKKKKKEIKALYPSPAPSPTNKKGRSKAKLLRSGGKISQSYGAKSRKNV
jgi:hypothetical protein